MTTPERLSNYPEVRCSCVQRVADSTRTQSIAPVDAAAETSSFHAGLHAVLANATLRVQLATSQFGALVPSLRILLPTSVNARYVQVVMHLFAARVEAAIPADLPWTVLVESERDYVGTVSVALKLGTLHEAANAMSMLRGVVSAATRKIGPASTSSAPSTFC
jgi:hypothetical protein